MVSDGDDPVLARRALVARVVRIAKRIGYTGLLVAIGLCPQLFELVDHQQHASGRAICGQQRRDSPFEVGPVAAKRLLQRRAHEIFVVHRNPPPGRAVYSSTAVRARMRRRRPDVGAAGVVYGERRRRRAMSDMTTAPGHARHEG